MSFLLHQLLLKSAKRTPDKQAVRHSGAHLTYAELDAQSDQLAAVLQRSGVERGDRVGIYIDKSLRGVVAIFGILKAGGVYVPLDHAAPKQRIAFIVENCAMKGIVSQKKTIDKLVDFSAESLSSLQSIILVDDESAEVAHPFPHVTTWDSIEKGGDKPTDPHVIEADLAYILYTSGSTGTPKGVMITHRTSLTFVDWVYETFEISADDRLSNHAPFHFDLSVLDIFSAIKAGATVILVPAMLSVFPRNLADFIANEAITVWYSVPSALTRLVLHGQLERYEYPHLRTVLFAGEVFPIKYLRQLMELLPHPRYYNLYGPTETNVCTYYEVPQLDPSRTAPLSIGKACENFDLFVLDEDNQRLPQGSEGELCARGPGVMSGYWGLPERTAKSRLMLTVNPILGPEVVYRTGDIVRQEADGNYTYLGRRDNMIKSRGYRIELGEIETALYSHPAVQEAAVIPIPDDQIGNRIKAFVVLNGGDHPNKSELTAFCASRIPKYMIPHAFDFRDALPKTSTGKVDRTTLRRGIKEIYANQQTTS